jgi:hypothetical protein
MTDDIAHHPNHANAYSEAMKAEIIAMSVASKQAGLNLSYDECKTLAHDNLAIEAMRDVPDPTAFMEQIVEAMRWLGWASHCQGRCLSCVTSLTRARILMSPEVEEYT